MLLWRVFIYYAMKCIFDDQKSSFQNQLESFHTYRESIFSFLRSFSQLTYIRQEYFISLLRDLNSEQRQALSQLQTYTAYLQQCLIETKEVELEEWEGKFFSLLKFMLPGILTAVREFLEQEGLPDKEALTLLNEIQKGAEEYFKILGQCRQSIIDRTAEEIKELYAQRRDLLTNNQTCPRHKLVSKLRSKYLREGMTKSQYQTEREAVYSRLETPMLRMVVEAFHDEPVLMVQKLKSEGYEEQKLNEAICTAWQLEELESLLNGTESSETSSSTYEKKKLFFKRCIVQIINLKGEQGENLIYTRSLWFYVFRLLAEAGYFGKTDYTGFCTRLGELGIEIPYPPTPNSLCQTGLEFKDKSYPDWVFKCESPRIKKIRLLSDKVFEILQQKCI